MSIGDQSDHGSLRKLAQLEESNGILASNKSDREWSPSVSPVLMDKSVYVLVDSVATAKGKAHYRRHRSAKVKDIRRKLPCLSAQPQAGNGCRF
jgi:hypothetical protein